MRLYRHEDTCLLTGNGTLSVVIKVRAWRSLVTQRAGQRPLGFEMEDGNLKSRKLGGTEDG